MKKMIYCTAAFLLMSVGLLNAQSVKAVYREEMKIPDKVKELNDPAVEAAVVAQLRSKIKTMVLYYDKGKSLFEQLSAETAASDTQDNVNVQTIRMTGDGQYYKDHKKNESVSLEYVMDKAFLITEPLSNEWKLEAEEKKIANHTCKKAVNDKNVTAWYCPDIPISDGPYRYRGLPGLILEVETPTIIVTLQSIDFESNVKDKVQPPVGGKKISREEYNAVLDRKKAEMGVGEKGGGVRVIKM